jgi:hypothetical protein
VQADVKVITPLIRAITVPDHITAEAQSWWPLAIDLTIAALDTGIGGRIMSGGLVTGHGGMGGKCGSVAITSREDTSSPPVARRPNVSGLPGRDQSTQQTEKSADERFKKIMAP